MAKKVKHSDLIESGIFEKDLPAIEAQIAALDLLESKYKEVLKATSKLNANNIKSKKSIDEFTAATQKSRNAVDGLKEVNEQKTRVQKQLIAAQDKEIKGKLRLQRANKEQRDALKAEIVLNDKLAGTEEKLLARNTQLRLARKKLDLETRKGRKELKLINNELNKNNALIDKNSDKLKKQKRNVGNYGSALSGVRSALAGFGVAVGGATVIRNVVGIFSGFQQEGANLASVLGKTRKEITLLTEDAKRLGASTAFTAKEVVQLQTEFAKLGFSEQEILDATEATLSLAAATGTELSEAAAVAGATLGGFGLEADETQRVVDVMAKSFSTSALDMEKFRESMKSAAPAARAVNVSVEETTALLGTLANAGISGSKAGNNLKTSFINLNKAGLTLKQGLDKVAKSDNKLATATELVGKNAAASFLVLAEGTEKTKELKEGLDNAAGAAETMANEQLNTLSGKTKLLTSAWEGFVLSLEDGDGVIAQVLKGAIDLTTEFLTALTQLGQTQEQINQSYTSGFAKGSTKREQDRITRLKELLELSNEDLEILGKTEAAAKTTLNLRNKGASDLNILLLETNQLAGDFDKLLAEEQKKLDNVNKGLEGKTQAYKDQIFATQKVKDVVFDISSYEAASVVYNKEINKLLKSSTEEELKQITAIKSKNENQIKTQKLAEAELQRRKDVGKVDIEGKGKGGKTPKSKVTEEFDFELQRYLDFYEEAKELTREHNLWLDQEYERQLTDYEDFIQEDKDLKKERLDYEAFLALMEEDKEKARLQRLEDARIKRAQMLGDGADAINELLQEKSQERLDIIEKEIEANQMQQQTLQELAAKGVLNAGENLAFEKKRAAELALLKEREIKDAARQELALTAIKTYSGYVQGGETGGAALARTVTDISLLKNLVSTLDFFYEGTENTGTASNPLDSNGGRLAVLHDNERVMTAEQNKLVSGLTNWELANLGAEYKKGENIVNDAIVSQRFQSNEAILSKFESLESAVKNIDMPEVNFHYDSIKNAFIKTVESQGKIDRTIYKKSKLF